MGGIGYPMGMRSRVLLLLAALVALPLGAVAEDAPAARAPASPAAACAEYDGDAVSLRGTITLETFPGPPNFNNLYRGDEPITEGTIFRITVSSSSKINFRSFSKEISFCKSKYLNKI